MKRFKNILYVSESSVAQESALARAVSLAENNQAELTVIAVMPALGDSLQATLDGEQRQMLEALLAPHREKLQIHLELRQGKTFLEAVRAVLRNHHDLVIKPSENPDYLERLFGSDDMHLLRKCPCPVWLVKADDKTNYQRILAAVDFDPESLDQQPNADILKLASSLALSDFAELHLAHAWEAPAEMLVRSRSNNKAADQYVEAEHIRHRQAMDALPQRLREWVGGDAYDYLKPHYHLIHGPARKVIPETAQQLQADLVVMGTLARTGIPGFFIGNTAEAILEQLQCSLLAVKPPGFVSPVTVD